MPRISNSQRLNESAAAILLVAALLFGGGSRGLGDFTVHLLALPVLLLGWVAWRPAQWNRLQKLFGLLLLAATGLILLQLLPLPASLYAALPQRAEVLTELRAAGLEPAGLPMTLDVWGSVRALLSLVVFAAMWLIASGLSSESRLRLLKLALFTATAMALLGFWQAAAGHQPTLRFYEFHNTFGATATFANRNHFASLLAMLLPIALVLGGRAQAQRERPWMITWYSVAVILLLGAALTYSRSGMLLASLAAVVGGFAAWRAAAERRRSSGLGTKLPLIAVAVAAAGAVFNYAWQILLGRFDQDPMEDLRWQYLEHGREAATAYLPWGSGFGSFKPVYAGHEPIEAMVGSHALHAHNDLLELAIEAGLPGLLLTALMLALIGWGIARRIRPSVRARYLGIAVAVAVLVPLLHSISDYPLRTLAVLATWALLLSELMIARTNGEAGPSRGGTKADSDSAT